MTRAPRTGVLRGFLQVLRWRQRSAALRSTELGPQSRRRDVVLSRVGVATRSRRDMTQGLVAPPLDFGGTPSMCVVVSIGETDGHHCFELHGAQQRQARR
jgi:hypothetical protein